MIPALMPNYARADLAFTHGEGAWLFSTTGERYLDFGAGIATSSLGHGHPHLTAAIAGQAARVIHISNLYRCLATETLAQRLVDASFADTVFFCNSGAEANEALVKAMRKTMADAGQPARTRVICCEGAFHGRTLAMIAATGNPKYLAGFGPVVEGFDHVPYDDITAMRAAITPHTAGILIEPVQGEGGVRPASLAYLRDLRALCDEQGLLLGLDEVQCGMGRTGKLFAHEWAGITPDLLSIAKGMAGGMPMGALLASEQAGRALTPGSHGTTFGGGPLAAAAANAVLDVILAPGFLDHLNDTARYLWAGLAGLARRHPAIFTEARGAGLILGLKCAIPNTQMQTAALAQGLLTIAAGDNVLRLVPPLIITRQEVDDAIGRLDAAARQTAAVLLEAVPLEAVP